MKHNVLKQSTGMMTVLLLAVLLFTATVPASTQASGQPPLLALASSFRDLWPELSQLYSEQTGQPVPRTSFASSGLLSTQIRHGAPFELFLSADEASVDRLHAAGKTRDAGALLARGTLSLVSLRNQGDDTDEQDLDHTPTLSMLNEGIERQQAFRIAIPNPQHAPYGKAARESLQNNGLWPLPPGFLLNAENAAQTLQFALTGAVEYAIVPDSLLIGAPAELLVTPLPADSYRAVVHKMVLLESAGLQAERLFNWLQQPSASAVLARHGLTPVH
ncbi:molybdate ABC transporter substrate-binding protein [Granulosicoccus sp. 3-233]